jgi:hypothetical protein
MAVRVIPKNLCMRKMVCEYCDMKLETVKDIVILRLFGIRTCDEHVKCGIRDVEAYLHENNYVNINTVSLDHELSPFIDMIAKPDFTFSESFNGIHEKGWKLLVDPTEFTYIIKRNMQWCIPAYLPSKGDQMYMSLINLINGDPTSNTIVDNAIKTLEKGIYIDSYNASCGLAEKPPLSDDPKLIETIMHNGVPVRCVRNM